MDLPNANGDPALQGAPLNPALLDPQAARSGLSASGRQSTDPGNGAEMAMVSTPTGTQMKQAFRATQSHASLLTNL